MARLKALLDFQRVFGFEVGMCAVGAYNVAGAAALAPVIGAQYSGQVIVAGAQLCSKSIGRLVGDVKTFIDPPLADYDEVATVPVARSDRVSKRPCSHATRNSLRSCLSRAIATLLSADQQVTSVALAIATTVARDAAARDANDQAGVALQEHAISLLETQFSSAQRSVAAAGGQLEELLRHVHGSGRLPKQRYATGLALLYKHLAAAGVTKRDVEAILGRTPPTTPPNLLSTLARA
jgi:hypothetical protein